MMQNIVLTGFMGTGKTTVGKLLAATLGYQFVDTDVVIEGRYGSIADIFAVQGEGVFREMEREVARELGLAVGQVIATGGRMMLDPENVAALRENGRFFCLTASSEAILARVSSDSKRIKRPLLQVADPAQRIKTLLQERQAMYDQFPQVQTDGKEPEAVAQEILKRFQQQGEP